MFYFDDFYGKKVLKSTFLKDVDCFFTTRSFVLTFADRVDLKTTAQENREFLKDKLKAAEIVTSKQIHGSNIIITEKGKNFYDDTDALISRIPDTLMLLNFADCVPVILYSKKYNTGALIHAGWRGTAQEISRKTAEKMSMSFKIPPDEITALIGPAIGKCCFETDENVFSELIRENSETELYEKRKNKYYIDLKLLNRNQLQKAGIKNIDICSFCTCCMSDIFFSYRKENGITARHSAIIKIKGGNYVRN